MVESIEALLYKDRLEVFNRLRATYPDIKIEDLPRVSSQLIQALNRQNCHDNCPGVGRCQTHGYMPVVQREADGLSFKYLVRYGPCSSYKQEQEQQIIKKTVGNSGIPERFKDCSFDNFMTLPCDDKVKIAKSLAMDCAAAGKSLVLMGPPGTGKTHLAVAMVNYYRQNGKSAVFIPVISLLDKIKEGFDSNSASLEIEAAARAAAFVVIDDLGAQKDTSWVTERLFELIDYRYRESKPMAITTNAEKLEQFSELAGARGIMIASRMSDEHYGRFISLSKCRDFRGIRKQQKLL